MKTHRIQVPDAYHDVLGTSIMLREHNYLAFSYDHIYKRMLLRALELAENAKITFTAGREFRSDVHINAYNINIIFDTNGKNSISRQNISRQLLFVIEAKRLSCDYLLFSRSYSKEDVQECRFLKVDSKDLFQFIKEAADIITISSQD